ncbi:polysaccharide lyase 6 family protein [Xanthomonas medicagonis]|uniref:polysaccharide lyase 6 family protein n=1 Tax=Xanthomonas medicagonis TaxID=3160841 RepID=UPI0035169555
MAIPAPRHCVALLALALAASQASAADILVATPAEYLAATAALQPGDQVILADGEWRDFQIVFTGQGTAAQPIRLRAQTPGKVIVTGQSNLRMAGEYLLVSGLVFRDGYTPTEAVLSYRVSSKQRARHSRISGVVIDRFNQPERSRSDNWVAMYDNDNRFDHNQLVGKNNAGPTMVVVRDTVQGLDNRHRIDHNWFGPRPNLGANGGETLRIGTSNDAGSDSNSLVENNWFEGCDGEVEIVSNKSGGNTYRGNVFKRSRGALVLRHGDGNLVENNVFFGDGKDDTGGVRVINRRQTVRNNYFEGLAGDGYSAALSIMYGVPNSPANRYVQVQQALIEHNTFVTSKQLFFGAGKDDERTAAPIDSDFADNLIVAEHDPVRVLGDLSGISFSGNLQSPNASPRLPGGVTGRTLAMTRAATGLLVAADAGGIGADPALTYVPRDDVGVAWYAKETVPVALDSGRRQRVRPGNDTLAHAVAAAGAGDRLQLDAGRYQVDQVLALHHPLSVEGPVRGQARIAFSRATLFQIEAGGALKLARLQIDGSGAADQVGNAVIRTAPGSNAANYDLVIEDSRIHGLAGNRGFDVIALGKGTLAERIALRRVVVEDVSGAVLSARAETNDRGTYNAAWVEIADAQFRRIAGPAVDLYRGGRDESTFGPVLTVSGSRFERVGGAQVPSLRLHGVQRTFLHDNQFVDSAALSVIRTTGTPQLTATRNQFLGTPALSADAGAEPLL